MEGREVARNVGSEVRGQGGREVPARLSPEPSTLRAPPAPSEPPPAPSELPARSETRYPLLCAREAPWQTALESVLGGV